MIGKGERMLAIVLGFLLVGEGSYACCLVKRT